MLKVLRSKYWHSKGRFFVLLLILVLLSLFLSLGMQLYMQSIQSVQVIEGNTTTIAVEGSPEQAGAYQFDLETMQSVWVETERTIMERAAASSSAIVLQTGTTMSAHINGLFPVLPTPAQNFTYDGSDIGQLASRAMLSAFRVRIDLVSPGIYQEETDEYGFTVQTGGKTENTKSIYNLLEYTAEATVLETLIIHEQQYMPSEKVKLYCSYRADDGSTLMEVGKEYIIFCIYDDPMPLRAHSPIKGMIYKRDEQMICTMYLHLLPHEYAYSPFILEDKYFRQADGKWYAEPIIPDFARAYPFILEVGDPRVEEMLAWIRLNSELVTVTGVHTADSLPIFAWEDAYIAEGRDMTRQEDDSGARVCLVSKAFADHHGLQLGDVLPMELYQNEWYEAPGSLQQYELPYAGEMTPSATVDYEIVGIYVAPEWVCSRYTFSPNTILVPESSLPVDGQTGIHYATSLILKNGANEQFLADTVEMGIPEDTFHIYDGGYMEFVESLQLMQKDTRLVLAVCIFLYLVVTLSALYMMVQHLKQDAATMMKVGASRGYAVRYMLGCVLPVVVLSAVIAYGISCLIYAPLMETLEAWYVLVRPAYSNLTASSAGMLTGTISDYPSPVGAIAGVGAACAMTAALVLACKERRAKT